MTSDLTAFRVVDRVPSERLLEDLRAAHVRARERFWRHGSLERVTIIDLDATLIAPHSENEGATSTYKGGYGFTRCTRMPMKREALAVMLRPGNAGADMAADHKGVLDRALQPIPEEHIERIEILVRGDRAGATHETAGYCRDARCASPSAMT